MKEETIKQVEEAIAAWSYIKTLPKEWFDFKLEYDMHSYGDVYDIFTYKNDEMKRKVTVYYHDETKEYKLRVTIGLIEFCNCDFIMPDLESLEKILRLRLETLMHDTAYFNKEAVDSIVIDKKILEWTYLDHIPEKIEGFTRFIKPSEPLKVINGSYIIFDYCDFDNESSFAIYYNIFRDEFFGEAKVRNIPEVNYLFDSHELSELEEKLDLYLVERLKQIRAKINHNKL